MKHVAITLLLLATAAAIHGQPFDFQTYFHAFQCPIDNDTAWVTVTLPLESQGTSNTKFPTIVVINGFVVRSCVYAQYAEELAKRGYAVIQYDDSKNPLSDFQASFHDALRLHWVDEVIECTKKAAVFASHFDFSKLALVGHSRGGKLAGLYFAQQYGPQRPDLKAAFLIDPIDAPLVEEDKCIQFYPSYNKTTYPNLAQDLSAVTAPVAIIGANMTSKCNCNTSNYQEIWPHTGPGSWLFVLAQAGHLQVTDDSLKGCTKENFVERLILKTVYSDPSKVPLVGKYLGQWTCSKGNLSTQEAMDLVTVPMLAWLDQQVKGIPPPPEYGSWVAAREANGTLEYLVKEADNALAAET